MSEEKLSVFGPVPVLLQQTVTRLAVFAGAWIVFTGGDAASWTVGLPTVIAATAVSLALSRRREAVLRIQRLPPFALRFLLDSCRGGIDVAYRALHPSLPIRPGIIRAPPAGSHAAARGLTASIMNLLPGSVTVEEEAEHLHVHVLDTSLTGTEDIIRQTQRVDAVFARLTVDRKRDQ